MERGRMCERMEEKEGGEVNSERAYSRNGVQEEGGKEEEGGEDALGGAGRRRRGDLEAGRRGGCQKKGEYVEGKEMRGKEAEFGRKREEEPSPRE
ncbi:hypothetical protein Tco_0291394 [Tanacetum coccineum]